MSADLLELAVTNELLKDGGIHSEEEIRQCLHRYRSAIHVSDEEAERVYKSLQTKLHVDVDLGITLSQDFEPWLADSRADISWRRWLSYKQLLLRQGRPHRVVDALGSITDDILELVGDPRIEDSWSRRGLVIGDVQSGKTSTYLGVLNKAADAGYKLIIVLAGGTEVLRQQTQERIDEGLIGRDSSLDITAGGQIRRDRIFGVGLSDRKFVSAQGMTTYHYDFRKRSREVSNFSMDDMSSTPHVFVLKKNKSVLRATAEWLSQQINVGDRLNAPMLLLDDESDYASINTREEEDPTAINRGIRDLLALSHRNSYLAFTATPFANIFIDHSAEEDLFPRDYIYALEAPSNYVGAAATFGTDDDLPPAVIAIRDAGEHIPLSHKSIHQVEELPDSLQDALRAFVVAAAIRDLREPGLPAQSMLVNVSRFKAVQEQVFTLVKDEFAHLRSAIELHSTSYNDDAHHFELNMLRRIHRELYPDSGIPWPELLGQLSSTVADVDVRLYNSDNKPPPEEPGAPPVRMIAVGGNVLSRGLTLPGLITSYFYRSAGASDTLLQMARWFGYRDGYADLTRLWIDESVAYNFQRVHEATEELRRDLGVMKQQRLTPNDFGLAVKKHPNSLLITARNKMKSTEVTTRTISLVGRRLETVKLPTARDLLSGNDTAIRDLLRDIGATDGRWEELRPGSKWRVRNRVQRELVARLLTSFSAGGSDPYFGDQELAKWLTNATSPSLQRWRVVLVAGSSSDGLSVGDGLVINPPQRKIEIRGDSELWILGGRQRLAGRQDVYNMLMDPEAAKPDAEMEVPTIADPEASEEHHYWRFDSPILALYPLVSKSHLPRLDGVPLWALKLIIPGRSSRTSDTSGDVEYVVNSVAKRMWSREIREEMVDDDDLG